MDSLYLVREGRMMMRTYLTFDAALTRFHHVVRNNSNIDDVELYKISQVGDSELCDCIHFKKGQYLASLENDISNIHDMIKQNKMFLSSRAEDPETT